MATYLPFSLRERLADADGVNSEVDWVKDAAKGAYYRYGVST